MLIDKYPLYFLNRYNNSFELLYVVHAETYSYIGVHGGVNGKHQRYPRRRLREWVRELFVQITPEILSEQIRKRFEFPEEVLQVIENLDNEYEEDIEYDD